MDSSPFPKVLVRGPMGSLRRAESLKRTDSSLKRADSSLRRGDSLAAGASVAFESSTLFWLLFNQIGSVICDSIYQLRPSNLCSIIGSTVRGALDSISSIFNPRQRQVHKWVRSEVPFKEIPSITSVWADGSILCVLVENAIAPNQDTTYHLDKYQHLGHVTLPNIRLGQQLARQYLCVDPEFTNNELQKEADAEIIHRLVKYLQHVKKASKLAKTSTKPFELHERRPSDKGKTEETEKERICKAADAARKRKVVVRRRRHSKTADKASLNYSLVCSTVIPESANDGVDDATKLQSLLQDDFFSKCKEIQSVCEMLLERSSKRKSLQIFNKATRILSRKSSEEKLKLTEELDEPKCDKNDGPQGEEKPLQRRPSEQKIVVSSINVETITRKQSLDAGKGRNSRRNSSQQQEHAPVARKRPPKVKAKPKLDKIKRDEVFDRERRHSVEEIEKLAADVAKTNVTDEATNDVEGFARRLSQSLNVLEETLKKPTIDIQPKPRKLCSKNNSVERQEFNGGVFKARRDAFLSVGSQSVPGTSMKVSAREKRKKSLGAGIEESKRRYESAKNFFQHMEQQSCSFDRKSSEVIASKGARRGSELWSPNPQQAEFEQFRSCRSTRSPPGRLHVADVFCQEETTQQAAKTIDVPEMSAVVASLNSAYNENEVRPRSPYALVHEGSAEDDLEPADPDRQTLDGSRRRVSYSQLNEQGDAGIF